MTAPAAAAPPGGRVGFVELADRYRVIRTSPAWSEVERAMAWAEQRAREGKLDVLDERLAYIGQFAELLRVTAPLIAQAMLLAAMLGAARPAGTRGERIVAGLDALSRAYGWERLGVLEVSNTLARLRAAAAARLPTLAAWLQLPEPELRGDDAAAWEGEVAARLDQLDALAREITFDLPACARAAWEAWRARLGGASPEDDDPAFDELLCAVAGLAPSAILGFDRRRVSIGQWSRLLAGALRRPAPEGWPAWAPLVALDALGAGFAIGGDEVTPVAWLKAARVDTTALEALLAGWSGLLSRPQPRTAALVLRGEAPTWVDTITPVADALVLALTVEDATALLDALPSGARLTMAPPGARGPAGALRIPVLQLLVDSPAPPAAGPPPDGVQRVLRRLGELAGPTPAALRVHAPPPQGMTPAEGIAAPTSEEQLAALLQGAGRARAMPA